MRNKNNPKIIRVEDKKRDPRIHHVLVNCKHREYKETLYGILDGFKPYICLIFANSKKEADETYKNFINIPIKEKNISFLTIRNNFANLKRPNIPLPNINKIKIKRPTKSLERDKNISCNNIKTPKLIKKLSINNKENFTFFQQDKLNIKEENKEKNNADNVKMIFNHKTLNSTNNNKFMRIHKTLKFQKYTKNFEDTSASELIFTKNIASLNTPSSRIIHPILGLNKLSNNILIIIMLLQCLTTT